ncbi:MAG: ABC transporter substrate-binding protein [Dehalococcoidia bacterium]|nr:ABC transporter substrate-binding protein [Dehalococcoidia bacterium]MSQ16517.1 ABC transporter substrate-binding protein [Dehalococcoidia bacterium]
MRLRAYRATYLAGLVALLGLLAVACGAAAPATPSAATPRPTTSGTAATPVASPAPATATAPIKPAGKITMMNGNWAKQQFDPLGGDNEGTVYMRTLHGYLIAGNDQAKMVPGIATGWSVSADGKTWTFTIRKGVKFHNGEEMTMDDVLFSQLHSHGPDVPTNTTISTLINQAKQTEKVEQTGPDKISWTHTKPLANFAFYQSELFGSQHAGVILPKKVFDTVGRTGYEKNPISAGTAKLVKYVPSEQMLFERFDDYYYQPANGFPEDRRLKIQTLDMRLVPEESTRVAALRSGEADLIEASLVSRKQIEGAGGKVIFSRESSYGQIQFLQCWQPELWCNKKDVRHALDYAIDKNLIRTTLYGTDVMESKGWTLVTPTALGYGPELDPFPYDVAKAKDLLAKAGYPGGAGFPPFKIQTWAAGDFPFLPEMSLLVADMWKKNLGLDVQVNTGEAVGIREKWQAFQLGGDVMLRSNEGRWDGGSSIIGAYALPESRTRRTDDPALRAAVQEALAVMTPTDRQAAYNKMYRTLYDAHYEVGLGYVNLPWGLGPRVADWKPWPLSAYATAMWTVTLK